MCLALQKAKDAWGDGLSFWADRRHEQRHGRRTKGPELSLASLKVFRRDAGIRLRLQGESMGAKLIPWGRSYASTSRCLEARIVVLTLSRNRRRPSAVLERLSSSLAYGNFPFLKCLLRVQYLSYLLDQGVSSERLFQERRVGCQPSMSSDGVVCIP